MIYIIPKGKNNCRHPLSWHNGTVKEARLVTLTDWHTGGTYTFISKIWGYAYGNHHYSSARLGIKLFPDYARLVTYVYDLGVRIKEKKIIDIEYGSTFVSSIDFESHTWVFRVDNKTVLVPAAARVQAGFYLFPYFGGTETAPKNIITEIQKL